MLMHAFYISQPNGARARRAVGRATGRFWWGHLFVGLFIVATAHGYAQTSAQDREVPSDAASIPGVTELMLAAGQSPPATVREIVQDVTPAMLAAADENGNTALHWAAFFATDPGTIDALLDAEIPVDRPNTQGLTAFEIIQGNDSLVGTNAYRRLLRVKLENRSQ